jgi:hypothetical protein
MPDVELDGRYIRYRDDYRGDIVHLDPSKSNVLHREPCSRQAVRRLVSHDPRPGDRVHLQATFNASALDEIDGVERISFLRKVEDVIECATGEGKSIGRHSNKGYEIAYFSVNRRTEPFTANMRYEVDVTPHGICFREMEPISYDNLNRRYMKPVMSVYVVNSGRNR